MSLNSPDRSHPDVKFGDCVFSFQTLKLRRTGKAVKLVGQPLALLMLLLEHPGRVVTRQDIRGRLWPDTTVDFDHGLDVALSRLRSALGDSGRDPRVIETVPGVGYRIAISVETVMAATTPPTRTRYEWRRVLTWAIVAALVAAALTFVIVRSRYDRFVPRAVQGQR